MAALAEIDFHRRVQRLRVATWFGAGALLLLPLVAMQFTAEVRWDVADFVIFGAMLATAGGAFELFVRRSRASAYLAGGAVAVLAAFLLVWSNLAVGLIGSEDNLANWMFVIPLALLAIGSAVVRLRATEMTRVLVATALAQVAIGAIALAARLGSDAAIWPRDILMATGLFTATWLLSAWLFRRAAVVA